MKRNIKYLIKFTGLSLIALILSFIAFYSSYTYESDDFEITFIDVGQGDSAYIKTPDNFRILIDGGDENSYDKYLGKFFGRRKIAHINSAVVSHHHSDHASGVLETLYKKRVDTVFVPKSAYRSTLLEDKLSAACKEIGIKYVKREIGEIIYNGDDGVRIKAVFPNDFIYENAGDSFDENNDSLVLIAEYAGKKILLTGDINESVEEAISLYCEVDADILKVPHHGSAGSSSELFIDTVSPEYAVISCGKNNYYGFPTERVLDILNLKGIKTLRTDIHGDITFVIDENGKIEVKTSKR